MLTEMSRISSCFSKVQEVRPWIVHTSWSDRDWYVVGWRGRSRPVSWMKRKHHFLFKVASYSVLPRNFTSMCPPEFVPDISRAITRTDKSQSLIMHREGAYTNRRKCAVRQNMEQKTEANASHQPYHCGWWKAKAWTSWEDWNLSIIFKRQATLQMERVPTRPGHPRSCVYTKRESHVFTIHQPGTHNLIRRAVDRKLIMSGEIQGARITSEYKAHYRLQ